MIRLLINQEFDSNGLIPDLENIKRYLQSEDVTFETFDYSHLAAIQSKGLEQALIRCDLDFGAQLVTDLSMAPENVRFIGTVDSLSYQNNSWIPRLKYFDVLRRKIVTHFGSVEIKESAGIISGATVCNGLVSVMVSLGFKNIILFVPDESEDIISDLAKYYIGVKIQSIPFSSLTQNQESTGLIINAIDLESNASLMSDLAYFNFMSANGIVIDLASKTPIHPLLFEADKAGLRTMKRQDIASFYDYESLRAICASVENTKDDFLKNYLEIETID